MSYTLVITEKPAASKKIADALAEGKPIKESTRGISYYKITRGNKDIVIACAVGHLYGLDEKKKSWDFPVFDIEWQPSYKTRKTSAFTKKYLEAIKKLAKEADEFIIATDLDTEGEIIGLNILRFACKQKDAERMKFSTLTKGDLVEAFDNRSSTLEWGLANAGEARHYLDYFNGISYSRALTHAIKQAGAFKIMSTGRVQGPTLKIIVDREKEIKIFKPVPFWQIQLLGNVKNEDITAWHKQDKFWDKKEADKVIKNVKDQKKGIVDKVERKQFQQRPPFPFDLTTLQIEAYRCHGIQPKDTLSIAQELYTSGYISYPRTSSQQLPPKIGYNKILRALSKQTNYSNLCSNLLKKPLRPNNGKKTDPAHPAIYPTGIAPKLEGKQFKIYDLIARRFLATFAESALRETMIVDIDVNKEIFIAKGTRTIKKGWHIYYGPYVKLEEIELPAVEKGDIVDIKKITMHEKETQPPKRYTPASIIKELEKRNLGTKCLTSNNLVKINSNNQIHNENIAELFNSLYNDFPLEEQGMKIAINNKKTCFSFNEFDETRSHFKLVSKRKLNKNEKTYKIEYNDGSFIEATEYHPFLIFEEDSCKYIPTKELKKGMRSVASIKFHNKVGKEIYSWDQFLKKCDKKTSLYANYDFKKIRKKLSQYNFAKRYDLSQPRISEYEKRKNIPIYLFKKLNLDKPDYLNSENKNLKIKNPFPLRMSSSLARILANLVGDCSIDSKKIMRENCYDFRYHNTSINLINKFIKDIKTVFGFDLAIKLGKPRPGHLPKYYTRIPAVVGRIISVLFREVIKKNAVEIHSEFYPEFIGALFDDEGHSMKNEPKLFVSNTNFKLLEDVKQMLSTLDIKALLEKKQFKLYIRGRENIQKFLEKVPFISLEKKQRLINNLTTRYSWKDYPIVKKERDILALLNLVQDKELTLKEIAEKIGLPIPNTKETVKSLRKKGFTKKIVKGISEYPRKRITYKLVKPIENTFYTYIDEKVISADFITKTIKSVEKIDYDGFVYDITNNSEIPNFILSNGVVVHNSTRAQIIDTLFQRGYVHGKAIEATELGIRTIETLEKYCPKIIDEALTRHFEEEMEEIRESKKKKDKVLEEAKNALIKIINDFKKEEKEIGKDLLAAFRETRDVMTTLGKCPNCKEGDLQIRRGKFGSFAACSVYPKCKTTFSLPANAIIKPSKNLCPTCGFPMVTAIKKSKKPMEFCLNPKCKSKHVEGKAGKEAKAVAKGELEKPCPKCKKGKLVLRKSIYGSFYGCNQFPRCRYTEPLTKKPESNKTVPK